MSTVELKAKSFLRAFAIYIVPGLAVSMLLSLIAGPPDWRPMGVQGVLKAVVPMMVIAPLFETFILIYPTSIAGQAQKNRWIASAIGATPLIALHIVNGWPSVVGVAWGFVWSAYCWLRLSERETRFWPRYAFVAGLHALGNVVAIAPAAFDQVT